MPFLAQVLTALVLGALMTTAYVQAAEVSPLCEDHWSRYIRSGAFDSVRLHFKTNKRQHDDLCVTV